MSIEGTTFLLSMYKRQACTDHCLLQQRPCVLAVKRWKGV
jgi:hypothetical protein